MAVDEARYDWALDVRPVTDVSGRVLPDGLKVLGSFAQDREQVRNTPPDGWGDAPVTDRR